MSDKYKPEIGDIVAVPMRVVQGKNWLKLHAWESYDPIDYVDNKTDHGPITLISRPEPPAYFSGAKVGQGVWDTTLGYGSIMVINHNDRYTSIRCEFSAFPDGFVLYSINGKYERHAYEGHAVMQSLFYANDPRVTKLKEILGAGDE